MAPSLRLRNFDIYVQQHVSRRRVNGRKSILQGFARTLRKHYRAVSRFQHLANRTFTRWWRCQLSRLDLWPSRRDLRISGQCPSSIPTGPSFAARFRAGPLADPQKHWNLQCRTYRRPRLYGNVQHCLCRMHNRRLRAGNGLPRRVNGHLRHRDRLRISGWRPATPHSRYHRQCLQSLQRGAGIQSTRRMLRLLQLEILQKQPLRGHDDELHGLVDQLSNEDRDVQDSGLVGLSG